MFRAPPARASDELTHRPALAAGLVAVGLYLRAWGDRESRRTEAEQLFAQKEDRAGGEGEGGRVAVDRRFLRRLLALLRVVVPGPLSPEAGYAATVAVMMVARTLCDLWMLRTSTAIEATIVGRDAAAFARAIGQFVLVSGPIAVVNNVLKYSLAELAMRFRERLTRHLFARYVQGFTYYQVSNLDNRVSNPDQVLTQDVERFCTSLANLYSNVSKPLLDIAVYSIKLSGTLGLGAPALMLGYLVASGTALTWLRRPTGRFTVNEQRLEGEFRYVNARLNTHSEEVAFYNGNEREREVLQGTFARLLGMLRRAQQFRFSLGVVDSVVAKYLATVVGYLIVCRPFLDPATPRLRGLSHADLMTDYQRNARMLLNLANAMGRLVLAGRELTRLAGFTSRLTDFVDVLRDVSAGHYQRSMVQPAGAGAGTGEGAGAEAGRARALAPGAGEVVRADNLIRFEDVPLVTPNGDVLVSSLSFEVPAGRNVLVAGPNGCGKSSLFRTLGELWPLFGGRMTKPAGTKLFYIPQRPYLTLGTLRDQVIYPDTVQRMASRGVCDRDLHQLLADVHLGPLVDRFGGWDAVRDWADVLSGGEKQRVAMARVFYHRPQFAILDECTSAVSVDVEGFMYTRCREVGITLFTVSHRKSLWQYHDYVLQMDGKGSCNFLPRDQAAEFGS